MSQTYLKHLFQLPYNLVKDLANEMKKCSGLNAKVIKLKN